MSIETQTPQYAKETERTVTSVGQEAYVRLDDAIKRALLENDITGRRADEFHLRDETLGLDVLVHGDTPVSGNKVAPAIFLDNLTTEDPDTFKRIVIQSTGELQVDASRVLTVEKAAEIAAFAEFVVTLPRVSHE